ncbi:helix-turn-helix transcriptional regulator [Gordonia westfalica]|uniref:Helix-turn-helix transcriptional regulator n=1 Tax=Gordonia westfalica TaxID=158898 RepID=A0ABU2GY38_9ACTN|nr:helix-turn-helix transcriptional regulator [Gordonia westfalica]MDS1116368.1 helix-turn-helix transcriptional regulator [Gordonia westfalica]
MSSEPTPGTDDDAAILTTVGAAITARREALGISQQGLARAAGTSRTFLRGIEAGERGPTVVTLTHIARALDTTPSTLIADIR